MENNKETTLSSFEYTNEVHATHLAFIVNTFVEETRLNFKKKTFTPEVYLKALMELKEHYNLKGFEAKNITNYEIEL